MRKIIVLFLFLFSFDTDAQNNVFWHLDEIQNNILTYRIHLLTASGVDEYKFNYRCLLPKQGWFLDLAFNVQDTKLPNNRYELVEIRNNNYQYKFIKNDSVTVRSNFNCGFVPESHTFLVAVNKKEILFVEGNFFKDPISNLFELDINEPDSFHSFIKIKLFSYKLENLKFKKLNNRFLVFTGYSKSTLSDVKVFVSRDYFDKISIEKL